MFITRNWLNQQLDDLKRWVRQYVHDAIYEAEEARKANAVPTPLVQGIDLAKADDVSATAILRRQEIERDKAEEATPKFRCQCKACWKERYLFYSDLITDFAMRGFFGRPGITKEQREAREAQPSPDCVHKQVDRLEKQVQLLMAHFKLKVEDVPGVAPTQKLASTAPKKARRSGR